MASATRIAFAKPELGRGEVSATLEVLRSGWLTSGELCTAFERAVASYARCSQAVGVSSGTAALHLALQALRIGRGDEVITTPLTFCATVNVILHVGATPVLADIGDDLNVEPSRVAALVTERTKAILPVHYAGLPCDMQRIWAIARNHGLKVIEDAAHAVGAEYRGVKIGGGSSDTVCFSFYANKNMTTGEGGMVTTNSAELAERIRILRLHGMSRDAWKRYSAEGSWYYEVVECGFKYNMPDILAAIGLVQLRKLDRMNARRAEIARRYNEAFAELDEVQLPPDRPDCKHAWHLYVLRLNLDRLTIDRARFIEEMAERGVQCSVHFIPIPLHPYYKRVLTLRDPCERALREYPRLVSLPIYPKLTDDQVEWVIQAVRDVVTRYRKPLVHPTGRTTDAG